MKIFYKKFLIFVLIASFVTPSVMLMRPKKADAFLGCIMNALGILNGINGAISSIMSVPVHDSATAQNTSQTAGNTQAQTFKECMLDALVSNLVNNLIKNFTASTVQWINSGFQGSPAFVTNPEGFFADYGDIVVGQMIEELGPVGQILCSPFDLDIRIALTFGFGPGQYTREIGCRLSDVQENVYRAFTSGQWGSNGWSNWIAISHSRNNSMSAYLSTQDAISSKLAEKIGLKNQEITLGRGFLNYTECAEYDENNYTSDGDPICIRETTKTPGSVIESQLNQTLPSGLRKIEVADEIDEILNALLNQAMQQVLGATGLLGQSQPSSRYGGKSALSQLRATYEEEQAQYTMVEPEGLECGDGPFVVAEQTVPADITYVNSTGDSITEKGVIAQGGTIDLDILNNYKPYFIVYSWNEDIGRYTAYKLKEPDTVNELYKWDIDTEKITHEKSGASFTPAQFEEKISMGCTNTQNNRWGTNLANDYITNNPNYLNDRATDENGVSVDENKGVERNLAFRTSAEASDVYYGDNTNHDPSKLVDGVITASYTETAITHRDYARTRYFKVTLNEPALVTKIVIYPSKYSRDEVIPTSLEQILGGYNTTIKLENTKKTQQTGGEIPFQIETKNGQGSIPTLVENENPLDLKAGVCLSAGKNKCLIEDTNLNNWPYSIKYIKPSSSNNSLQDQYLSKFGYFELTFTQDLTDKSKLVILDRLTTETYTNISYNGDYKWPLSLAEIQIFGVPESEIDDYIAKQTNTPTDTSTPTSLAKIKNADANGLIVYQNYNEQTINPVVRINIPTGEMPKTKITATLKRLDEIDGLKDWAFANVVNENNFKIYRTVSASQPVNDDLEIGTGSTKNIKIADPISLEDVYYKIEIPIRDNTETNNAPKGFYKLIFNFAEVDSNNNITKIIGDYTVNFEIK